MSFKFNFQIENDQVENNIDEFDNHDQINENQSKILEYKEMEFKNIKENQLEVVDFNRNEKLKKLIKPLDSSETSTEQLLDQKKTDLIPGVYEGGFKLWECAIDVINYLINNNVNLDNKNILDIGCGHGLPGLYCLGKNSKAVTFQDYNDEVLLKLTMPNFNINFSNNNNSGSGNELIKKCKFISGDWRFVDKILGDEKFDIMLTSDTLYNIQSFMKLHSLIANHLSSNGYCLLSAKTYYFGVGGGTKKFEELVTRENKLKITKLEDFKDGISNVREIFKLELLQ